MHSREEDEMYVNDEEVVLDWNQMSFAQRQRDAHEKWMELPNVIKRDYKDFAQFMESYMKMQRFKPSTQHDNPSYATSKDVKDKISLSKFKGDGSSPQELEEWATKLDTYFQLYPESDMVRFASLYLEDYAHQWWRHMVKQGNMPLSWEGLKREMNLAFISPLVLDTIKNGMSFLKRG